MYPQFSILLYFQCWIWKKKIQIPTASLYLFDKRYNNNTDLSDNDHHFLGVSHRLKRCFIMSTTVTMIIITWVFPTDWNVVLFPSLLMNAVNWLTFLRFLKWEMFLHDHAPLCVWNLPLKVKVWIDAINDINAVFWHP